MSKKSQIGWIALTVVCAAAAGWILRFRAAPAPKEGDRVVLEEAKRQFGDGVKVGESRDISKDEFLRQVEKEKREEAARYSAYPCHFSITIYAPIGPVERGERFEDPLTTALGDTGVVLGGGSSMETVDGRLVITEAGFSARTKTLEQGLAVIRKCLKAQGAHKTTKIHLTQPKEAVYGLDE